MMTRTERQEHLSKWKTSGKSKKAYAESAGIKYERFIYWFRAESKTSSSTGRFIKLVEDSNTSGIEVKLPNGVVVYVKEKLSLNLLKLLSDV